MLDELFTFPIVMIDGDNEDKKAEDKLRFGDLPNAQPDETEEDYDMIFGEAEYPYWDFVGIQDSWLPTQASLEKAMQGKFEGCTVRFLHIGQLLVPWSKKKFKAELKKFAEAYDLAHPKTMEKKQGVTIMAITAEQLKKEMEDGNNKPQEG